jgi:hypothetical protein
MSTLMPSGAIVRFSDFNPDPGGLGWRNSGGPGAYVSFNLSDMNYSLQGTTGVPEPAYLSIIGGLLILVARRLK